MSRTLKNRTTFNVQKRLELTQQQVLAYSRDFASIFRLEREKQRNLEQIHQKLRAIVNSISEAMVATDCELNIQDFNQAFKRLLAIQTDKILNKSLTTILSAELLQKNLEKINLRKQTAVNFECTFPNQPEVFFLATLSKILDERKQRTGYVFLFRDISEKKRFSQLKSHIITFASYEIQTPLHGLLGFLHLVYDNIQNRLSKDELTHFNFLIESGKNLQKMVDEMMCFLPLNHADELSRSLINVTELLPVAIKSLEIETQNPGIHIWVQGQTNAMILADRDLLIKAMENILKTFLVFLGSDGNIEIELVQTNSKLEVRFGCAEISLKDWEELLRQLNSPCLFPNGAEGLTIGLALSREIVEWNKGKIMMQIGDSKPLVVVFPLWNRAISMPAKEG